MAGRGLAAATREAYGRVARGYLAFLEQRGITGLDGADGGSVLAFLESLLDRWAKSSLFWVVSNFRPFLKFTGRANLVAAVNLAGVRRSRPIIEVLGDAEAGHGGPGVRRGARQREERGDHAARGDDRAAGLRHHRAAAG